MKIPISHYIIKLSELKKLWELRYLDHFYKINNSQDIWVRKTKNCTIDSWLRKPPLALSRINDVDVAVIWPLLRRLISVSPLASHAWDVWFPWVLLPLTFRVVDFREFLCLSQFTSCNICSNVSPFTSIYIQNLWRNTNKQQ